MPTRLSDFTREQGDPAFVMRKFVEIDLPAQPAREQPFVVVLPLNQLSIFCRHYDTGEALRQLPYFVIAEIGLTQIAGIDARILGDFDPRRHDEPEVQALLRPFDPMRKTLIYPLGQLVTDHAGYASFDLTPLRHEAVRERMAALFGPLAKDLAAMAPANAAVQAELGGAKPTVGLLRLWTLPFLDMTLAVDALKAGHVAPNFIALRMELTEADLDERGRDRVGTSMQNPNILDWRLSPSSFTTSGAGIIGEDGCETLLPTNLSTQQFRFRQIIRVPRRRTEREPNERSRGYRFAYVVEYLSEWFPIGHSLGQILYSLPLAPGEKVKIAIVDWSRHDRASRDEKTTFVEQLQHSQLRDRTLTEAVHVALTEWQTGDSIMGGLAGSAGASIPLGAVSLGAGAAHSLGASSASLEGGRDVTADTTQRISDSFQQASTAMRELKSTVVIQSEQGEKSNVQTRVVANYNHSHALTMLYYEVLRHYRVITRADRMRPALLVKFGGDPKSITMTSGDFTATFLLGKRHLLAPQLLDPKLASTFDAVARVALGESKLTRETAKWNATATTVDPGAKEFVRLIAQFTTGGDDSTEPVFVALILNDSRTFELQCDGAADEGTIVDPK